jgi:ATP-binding cassette subfamily B protein RaxB
MAVRAAFRDRSPVNAPAAIDTRIFPRRRVRHVRQSESAECGLAALAMVANWWGHDLDLGAMRRRFGVSSRGMGLRELMDAADEIGLAPRPLKIGLADLDALQLPAILHWEDRKSVV